MLLSFGSLSFSWSSSAFSVGSSIAIRLSFVRVLETSSSVYPTFLFRVFSCLGGAEFSVRVFTYASWITWLSFSELKRVWTCLTWLNWPSKRLMLLRTVLIRYLLSRIGTAMNETCTSTMSPFWISCGPIAWNLLHVTDVSLERWGVCTSKSLTPYPRSPSLFSGNSKLCFPPCARTMSLLPCWESRKGLCRFQLVEYPPSVLLLSEWSIDSQHRWLAILRTWNWCLLRWDNCPLPFWI